MFGSLFEVLEILRVHKTDLMIEPEQIRVPDSFSFFINLIHYPSSFSLISNILSVFVFVQKFIATLAPLATSNSSTSEQSLGQKLFYITLRYTAEPPNSKSFSLFNIYLFVFFMMIVIPICFMYFCFKKGFNLPSILYQTKGFLFLYYPIIFLYPWAIELSEELEYGIATNFEDKYFWIFSLSIFVLMVFVVWFSEWIAPIILQSPLFSDSHMVTRMFDMNIVTKYQLYQIVALVAVLVTHNDSISPYLFIIINFMNAFFAFSSVHKEPYLTSFDTYSSMCLYYATIFNPILCLIHVWYEQFTDEYVIFFSIVLNLIATLFSVYCFERQQRIIEELIMKDEITSLPLDLTMRVAQTAILSNIFPETLYIQLEEYFKATNDYNAYMANIYCRIITSRSIDVKLLDQIKPLLRISSLSWKQKFVAHELYQSVSHYLKFYFNVPGIDKIKREVEAYNNLSDRFWIESLTGDINSAVTTLTELRNKLDWLLIKFDTIYSFYASNPEVANLENTFFSYFRSCEDSMDVSMPEWLEFGPQLRKRQAKFTQFSIINNDFDQSDTCSESTSKISEADDHAVLQKISRNLQKYYHPIVPIGFISLYIVLCILIASFSIGVLYPFYNIINIVEPITELPNSLNRTFRTAISWSNFAHTLAHYTNCSHFTQQSKSDFYNILNIKNENDESLSVNELSLEMEELITDMHYDIRNITIQTNNLSNNLHLQLYQKSLNKPSIYMYHIESSKGIIDYFSDIKSIMVFYTTQVLKRIASESHNITCESSAIKFIKEDASTFFNISSSLEQEFLNSVDNYFSYIDELLDLDLDNTLILGLLAGIISIFVTAYTHVYSIKNAYNIIISHFRPSTHPNPKINITKSSEVAKMQLSPKVFITFAVHVISLFIFYSQFFIVWRISLQKYRSMMAECRVIVAVVQAGLRSSIATNSVLRIWQFNQTDLLQSVTLEAAEKIIESQHELLHCLSPSHLTKIREGRFPAGLDYQCDPANSKSLHDSYACWPLPHVITLFSMIIDSISRNTTIDMNSIEIEHLQHIFVMHSIQSYSKLATSFSSFAENSARDFMCLCFIEIMISIIYIIYNLVLILYMLVGRLGNTRHFGRLLFVLSPRMIAHNDCLLSFFIESNEKEQNQSHESTLFNLYEKSNVPLILISSSKTIVSFTKPIQTLFGYRSEQLIGQSIHLLIPTSESSYGHNDTKFYQQLQIVEKQQSEPCFQRDLIGMGSDGHIIHLHTNVMMMEFNDSNYFMIECYSYSDVLIYEEMISQYSEMCSDILQAYLPLRLFPEYIAPTNEILNTTFPRACLLFISSYGSTMTKSDMDNFEPMKTQLSYALGILDGSSNACVIEATCTHSLVLFVDKDGNDDYLRCAWDFYNSFRAIQDACKSGFIVEGDRADVNIFPLPDVPEEFKSEQMEIEDTIPYVPTMTIEPISEIMELFPPMMHYIKPGFIYVTKSLVQFASSEPVIVGKENNMDIYACENE